VDVRRSPCTVAQLGENRATSILNVQYTGYRCQLCVRLAGLHPRRHSPSQSFDNAIWPRTNACTAEDNTATCCTSTGPVSCLVAICAATAIHLVKVHFQCEIVRLGSHAEPGGKGTNKHIVGKAGLDDSLPRHTEQPWYDAVQHVSRYVEKCNLGPLLDRLGQSPIKIVSVQVHIRNGRPVANGSWKGSIQQVTECGKHLQIGPLSEKGGERAVKLIGTHVDPFQVGPGALYSILPVDGSQRPRTSAGWSNWTWSTAACRAAGCCPSTLLPARSSPQWILVKYRSSCCWRD
jgi:hypothetical protein